MNIKGNSVFWGDPEDTIANNLFRTSRNSLNPLPGVLAGVGQNLSARPSKPLSLTLGAKRMLSQHWDNSPGLANLGGASGAMRTALEYCAKEKGEEQKDEE